MKARKNLPHIAARIAFLILLGFLHLSTTPSTRAGLNVPYTADAYTLHLWHFDETNWFQNTSGIGGAFGGTNQCFDFATNAQTQPLTLSALGGVLNPPVGIPVNFVHLAQPAAYPSLGYSELSTQGTVLVAPYLIVTNSNGTTNNNGGNTSGVLPLNYTNITDFINPTTGAFTWEALIKPSVNPLAFPYSANIICGDSGFAVRAWQFRIDNGGILDYQDIHDNGFGGGVHTFTAQLPSTGPDAAVVGQWYHVALTYTGSTPTNGDPAHVLKMYWTLFQNTRTNCDLLATFTKTNNQGGYPFFAIGGSARGNLYNTVGGSGGFLGNIDEVRISSYCRASSNMCFNTSLVDQYPIISGEPPVSELVGYGTTLSINTTIAGTQPMQVQWTQNGVVLPGQTNATLIISNVTFAANGNYQCFATNTTVTYGTRGTNSTVCSVTVGSTFDGLYGTGLNNDGSLGAAGSVDQHWLIVTNPDPTTVYPDAIVWSGASPVSPNGGASANGPTSVWIGPEENGGPGSGTYAYQTSFLIDQTSLASATLNGAIKAFGPGAGSTAQLYVNGQETNLTLSSNPQAVSTPFTLTAANGLQAGSNTLVFVLGGALGFRADMSSIGNALTTAPVINNQPVSETIQYGSSATFSVVALGQPLLSYQWYWNGAPLNPASTPGATSGTLTLSATNGDLPTPLNNGSYQVVVSNNLGSVTSSVVQLTVNPIPVLISLPATYTNAVPLLAGASPAFSVLATNGLPPYSFQWYSNSVPLAGATNDYYQLTNLPAGIWGSLDCVVTNLYGSSTSMVWLISAISPSGPYPQAVMNSSPLGYWRLDEQDDGLGDANDGQIAHDYASGNNGVYTNTVLGQPGYTANNVVNTDPTETAAEFGTTVFADSDVINIPTDFSAPTNSNSNFTIEAWVQGVQETADSGLVSKGYSGAEQFSLDCGSDTISTANPQAHSFRFFVRDATGATHGVNSTVNPNDGHWHYLAGVCNETNGYVALYVDGVLTGTSAITPGSGIQSSVRAMLIGSRPGSVTTNNNLQFAGSVDDVAVYPRALNTAEVLSHYYAAGIAAVVSVQPTNFITGQNGTAVFSVVAAGTPPLAYQWYDGNTGLPISDSITIGGSTNATLVLNNVQSGDSYYLQVANAYGTNQSSTATLTVVSGLPQIYTDVPVEVFVMPGMTTSIPVAVYGTMPLSYQWQFNGANLADNGRISGSQSSNVLTIANAQPGDVGGYQVIVFNSSGSTTSSVASLVVGMLPLGLNYNGQSWSASGSARISDNLLSLTDPNNGGGGGSFFFQYPQYVGAFMASFTYQAGGSLAADGASFCIQNDPRGASALGGAGGGLSVSGITPSVELEFNLYNGNGEIRGYAVFTNGLTGAGGANGDYQPIGNVNLNSGDPIGVTVSYLNGSLALSFTDAVANLSFSTNLNVGNITKILGTNMAFVGFTGAYGGSSSVQTITNFSFTSIPQAAIVVNGTNALISWPGALLGYGLQQNYDLTTTNWLTISNQPSVINGYNQVVAPANGSSNVFYRLILQ